MVNEIDRDFVPFRTTSEKFDGWFEKRKKEHKNEIGDTVGVICGREQLGKSTLAIRILWAFWPEVFYKNGKFDLHNIIFNGADYIDRISTLEKSVLLDDEAATHFYGGDSQTKLTKNCVKAIKLCGSRRNFQILCIPSYWKLDRYIREERCGFLIHIKAKQEFEAWNFTEKESARDLLNKFRQFKNPHIRGRWNIKDDTVLYQKFLNAYRAEEDKRKSDEMKALKESVVTVEKPGEKKPLTEDQMRKKLVKQLHESGITQTAIAKATGFRRETINKWCNKPVIL
jgi:hypothetical protein